MAWYIHWEIFPEINRRIGFRAGGKDIGESKGPVETPTPFIAYAAIAL